MEKGWEEDEHPGITDRDLAQQSLHSEQEFRSIPGFSHTPAPEAVLLKSAGNRGIHSDALTKGHVNIYFLARRKFQRCEPACPEKETFPPNMLKNNYNT